MSNIQIRKNQGREMTPSSVEWEPLRALRNLIGWDPFGAMVPLGYEERAATFMPAFEIKETKDAFVFKADIPGIVEKDLDVQLTGNRLTVGGKRDAEREDQGDTYFVYERNYGTFTRTFTLPDGVDVDHIHAELQAGVLNLVLPKKPEALPKKITVAVGEKTRS